MKKFCSEPSSGQHQITPCISSTGREADAAEAAINVELEEPTTPVPSQPELPEADYSSVLHHLRYSLHLSDTKTRTRPTLPPEEDVFAGRVQLMLYHRLLSNALSSAQPDIASSQPLDFDAFWRKAEVDPTRRFSDSFLLQAGLSDAPQAPQEGESLENPAVDLSGIHCLNDLTRAWHHSVEALNAVRVDNTLTIVYRAQPTRAGRSAAPTPANPKGKEKQQENETGVGSTSESAVPSTPSSLSEREARDVAAAIQASISDIQPGAGGDGDLARAIFESLRDAIRSGQMSEGGELGILTHPFGPPISDTMRTLEGEGLGLGHGGSGAVAGGDTPARTHVAADGLALAEDPQLAWALQESLLARLKETPALKEAISEAVISSGADMPAADVVEEASEGDNGESGVAVGTLLSRAATEEPEGASKTAPSSPPAARVEGDEDEDEATITAAELETEAKIIGTKEFDLDDGLLDDYLESVLAWWYGERPPQGVDVDLTRRCVYVVFYVRGAVMLMWFVLLARASTGRGANGERRRPRRRCRSIRTGACPTLQRNGCDIWTREHLVNLGLVFIVALFYRYRLECNAHTHSVKFSPPNVGIPTHTVAARLFSHVHRLATLLYECSRDPVGDLSRSTSHKTRDKNGSRLRVHLGVA